jgi:hypothetical protein
MQRKEKSMQDLVLDKLDELYSFYVPHFLSGDSNELLGARLGIENIFYMQACVVSGRFTQAELSNFLLNQSRCSGKPCVSLGLA